MSSGTYEGAESIILNKSSTGNFSCIASINLLARVVPGSSPSSGCGQI